MGFINSFFVFYSPPFFQSFPRYLMRLHRLLFSALLAVFLTACGGGGGGNNADSSSNAGLQINLDTSSLDISLSEGQMPETKFIKATATGNMNQGLFVDGKITGQGIAAPITLTLDPSTNTGTIAINAQSGLSAGTYAGTIQIMACADKSCSRQYAGSPFNIPYKVTVLGKIKSSLTSVNLAAAETGSGTAQLPVTLPSGADGLQASIVYEGSQSGWLSTTVSNEAVTLQASAANLMSGTYRANLALSANMAVGTLNIPVTFTVSNGLVIPAQSTLRVDSETTQASMTQTMAVNKAPGVTTTHWSATSNQAWLTLDSASGDFSTPISWHIDPASFGQLPNNASHTATVRVQASGLTAQNVEVKVDKRLAEIKYVDLLALMPGVAGDVLVYGNNFDSLNSPASHIRVNGTAPQAVNRLAAGVLRLSMPASGAGNYSVTLTHAAPLPASASVFKVLAPSTFNYQATANTGLKTQLLWDAISKSLYVVNSDLSNVARYSLLNGSLVLAATRSFASIQSIGLNPDHSAVVLQEGASRLHLLSMNDLSTQKTIDLSANGTCCTSDNTQQNLPVMGDGTVYMPMHGWVDLLSGAVKSANFGTSNAFGAATWGAVSGNGMRMLLPDSGLYSPRGPIYRYELTDGLFRSVVPGNDATFFYRYAVDRDGSNWIFNDKVYGFDLSTKGNVRLPNGWYGNRMAMSRSGTRVYYYAQSGLPNDNARIYVFDTATALATDTDFPVLGYFELADKPNCPNSSSGSSSGCNPFSTLITLTDDEQTLLLAGDRNIIVAPIPANYRAPATVAAQPQFSIKRIR